MNNVWLDHDESSIVSLNESSSSVLYKLPARGWTSQRNRQHCLLFSIVNSFDTSANIVDDLVVEHDGNNRVFAQKVVFYTAASFIITAYELS